VDAKCNPSVLHVLDLHPYYTVRFSGEDVFLASEDQGAFFALAAAPSHMSAPASASAWMS